MLGLIYFFIVLCSGICWYIDRAEDRKDSFERAMRKGNPAYRDSYGRYWYGNTPCEIDFQDGHEVLVSKYDHSQVMVDFTQQKYAKTRRLLDFCLENGKRNREIAIKKLEPYFDSGFGAGKIYQEVTTGEYFSMYKALNSISIERQTLTINPDNTFKWNSGGVKSWEELEGDRLLWFLGKQSEEWKRNYIVENGWRDIYGIKEEEK